MRLSNSLNSEPCAHQVSLPLPLEMGSIDDYWHLISNINTSAAFELFLPQKSRQHERFNLLK